MPPDDNDTDDLKKQRPAEVSAGSKPNSLPDSKTSSFNPQPTSQLIDKTDEPSSDAPAPRYVYPRLDLANFRLAVKQYRVALATILIAVLTLIATSSPDFFPRHARLLWQSVNGPRKDQVRLPHVDRNKFTVLVAELDHDNEGTAREAIIVALEDTAGIVVDRLHTAIPAGKTTEVEAGHERARKYLKDSGANLLIWGSRLMVNGRERINLYFTPLQAAYPDTAKLYELDPQPDLVIDPAFLGDLVQAVQLAVVDYATTGHNKENCSNVAQQLRTLIDDVRQRVDGDRARSWSPTTHISVRLALAAALRTFGGTTGTQEPFTDAIGICRDAISEAKPRSEAWAASQVELGRSYLSLASWGTPEERVQNLKEALRSFRAALGVFRTGNRRALVQLFIGTSLIESAAAESVENPPNELTIQEALTTFRDALRSLDRQREPLWWGQARALLGAGLCASGLTPGDHRIVLAEAQSALRESLELTREGNPLGWAATQTMSGITSIALSNSDSPNGAAHLRDSVEAFNQALRVETRSCTPLEWAETHKELGEALALRGQRENNEEDLQKAADAYHAELEIHTNKDFPSEWASAQMGLAKVLSLQGLREHNAVLVCQSIYRMVLCAGTNRYCAQAGAFTYAFYYHFQMFDFDEHERQKCQAKLEWNIEFEGGWRNGPFYLLDPSSNDSGKPSSN